MASAPELPATVTALVDAALSDDDPARFVEVASRELRAPLGLVEPSGRALGRAPEDAVGERALAVAAAAARSGLVAAPGWWILPVARGGSRLGFAAIGDAARHSLLDLVVSLLAEQLQRGKLLRANNAAFLRRLVGEPDLGAPRLRREAGELQLRLADTYLPALLVWRDAVPRPDVIAAVERAAAEGRPGVLAVGVSSGIVLLHPGERPGAPAWFEAVVAAARRLAPAACAQALAADAPVGLGALGRRMSELEQLARLGPRTDSDLPVVSTSRYGLDRLLSQVLAHGESRTFVSEQIGTLIAWDHEHHRDLLIVLEAALDYPTNDQAAHRCYMHRNTFRHRLRLATDVLGHDLDDPDVRLATHVALKLRRRLDGHRPRPLRDDARRA
jgi:purine catabolism regulator